jgi:oligopeptide/dipeptide ABC transporter ATP-binding protein
MTDSPPSPILDVENLRVAFRTREGTLHAVNGVSFRLFPGETLGIVGESGSGKSVSVTSLIGLTPKARTEISADRALFEGADLLGQSAEGLRRIRGARIGMIFQDPMTSFNPVLTIGRQIAEPLIYHKGASRALARAKAVEMLHLVGIPHAEQRVHNYPHELSGGMRQRAMIAMALVCSPEVLFADEPTTALDVTVQAQIVELVRGIRDRLKMSVVWITHDLSLLAGFADRIAVMYGGRIVETGGVDEIYARPNHPYTQGLMQSLPKLRGPRQAELPQISGTPPTLYDAPAGCPFVDRCAVALDLCRHRPPPETALTDSHSSWCWRNGGADA